MLSPLDLEKRCDEPDGGRLPRQFTETGVFYNSLLVRATHPINIEWRTWSLHWNLEACNNPAAD